MAVLKVHTKSGDGWFGNQHPDLPILECFDGFGFAVGRP
jgi:hypothetical protein